jgi:type VI secretion system secreted protein VgrG
MMESRTRLRAITAAYTTLAGLPGHDYSGINLGGLILTPGVYKFTTSAFLTTGTTPTLTLNAEGDANAIFVFEIGSTLTTGSGSVVNVINGNAGTGVFWQVGSSATLGSGTAFAGNILALTSIELDTGATICGRALARNGEVTLEGNTISDTCLVTGGLNNNLGDFGSLGFAGSSEAAVPEPGTVPLLCVGLFALTLCGWQSRKRVA